MLVKQALHGDVGQFSLAVGAFGAGGLLGAIALLFVDPGRDRRHLISAAALGLGALVALGGAQPLAVGAARCCWPAPAWP